MPTERIGLVTLRHRSQASEYREFCCALYAHTDTFELEASSEPLGWGKASTLDFFKHDLMFDVVEGLLMEMMTSLADIKNGFVTTLALWFAYYHPKYFQKGGKGKKGKRKTTQ
ncbi:hypothetical protein SAMD00023353_2201680 [Rosellinia necatrix]|uniref:Uncharacterized protein n=1 Tax=Rosellinia necatrix TaxID=77044 RepID=A0A1S8A806_ROSNE|nr:hypothetical protein SAMD00023353_2201680 [Rosellinia necatrix]